MKPILNKKIFLNKSKSDTAALGYSIQVESNESEASPKELILRFSILKNYGINVFSFNGIIPNDEKDKHEFIVDVINQFKGLNKLITVIRRFIDDYDNLTPPNLTTEWNITNMSVCNLDGEPPLITALDKVVAPKGVKLKNNKNKFEFVITDLSYVARFPLNEAKVILDSLINFRTEVINYISDIKE